MIIDDSRGCASTTVEVAQRISYHYLASTSSPPQAPPGCSDRPPEGIFSDDYRPPEGILHLIEREVLERPVSRELYTGVRAKNKLERPVSRGLARMSSRQQKRQKRQEQETRDLESCAALEGKKVPKGASKIPKGLLN